MKNYSEVQETSMNSLETQIYQIISASNGVKGVDIATKLGIDRKTVNSVLSNSAALKAVVCQDGNYKWHIISEQSIRTPVNNNVVPTPDKDLQSICKYYLNCLALESSSSVSQFLTSDFSLKYAVLNGLAIYDHDASVLDLLTRISQNRDSKAYLGYPVKIYTIHSVNGSFRKIAPVFLFPVEYTGGKIDISWVPSINMEVIKSYSIGGNDALSIDLVNLETELGMNKPDADIDVDELVLRLKDIRQWDWAENIDPYNIPFAADFSHLSDGIYNRPVIIETEREKYTQGLESELMALANMPEENYKGTALYSWLKNKFNSVPATEIKPLLEVLPLNSEQAQAVETAIRSDLTIVTGPPGTGKSQVVTDLLVNIAWNGKSALFSSKNNKAVDVVEARVNGLCKRPMLLRIGSNQYAFRLSEIIEGLLSAHPNSTNKADMQFYLDEYNKKVFQAQDLLSTKNAIVEARNHLDDIEEKYCVVRKHIEKCFDRLSASDIGKIGPVAEAYSTAYFHAIKENNGFFVRLFWKSVSKKRNLAKNEAARAYDIYSKKYGLASVEGLSSSENVRQLVVDALEFNKALSVGLEYKKALDEIKKCETLEGIDKKLSENKDCTANIAFKLWDKWLSSQAVSFSTADRQQMTNFVKAMKLAGDIDLSGNPELRRQFTEISKKMTNFLRCWAVTSLSAKSRVPFISGLFDYVIIDEASQCDIASILPLLYRAKHAVIIGDPKQLSHISQLSRQQDLMLLQKYNVPPMWSYSVTSLYALAEAKTNMENSVQLKDHFRSCSEIIEFSNEEFYDGSLRTATKYNGLKPPAGEQPGIRWIDIKGKTIRPQSGSAYNSAEVEKIIQELKRLVNSGYEGTIGVTTPFRKQAEEIKAKLERDEAQLYDKLLRKHEFIADTVHKFQGDERDLMVFSTVVSLGAPPSTLGFLNSTGNLFNVAITRARAVLVIVGDFNFCRQCEVSYLRRFSEYFVRLNSIGLKKADNIILPDGREYPWVENPEQVSEWEKMFYTALYDSGIKTIPQYPADKYKLDLAIIQTNGNKLNIEVDGAMYHRSWNGELCYRDQLRNQRMFELGWDVKRFWVYQLRDDLSWCIDQVKQWINDNQ